MTLLNYPSKKLEILVGCHFVLIRNEKYFGMPYPKENLS